MTPDQLKAFHKKLKKLSATDQANGVTALKAAFKKASISLPPLPGPNKNDLVDLSWALQDADMRDSPDKVGACGYIVDGLPPQCCNLTAEHCALIPNSTFDATARCPPPPQQP
jgi:hypothetical protein